MSLTEKMLYREKIQVSVIATPFHTTLHLRRKALGPSNVIPSYERPVIQSLVIYDAAII